jgi:hypothetical protein
MRNFLLLALLAICAALPLAGCSGTCGPASEPVMEIKSPIWFRSQPTLQPQNYAIAAPAQQILVPVPQVQQAPAYRYAPIVQPRAVGPCGGGQPFNPPPVPTPTDPDDPPESIPAIRR